jgi:hypothetical protein
MGTPTKYFHDRSILLLLVLNSVLVVVGILSILFRLDNSKGSSYFIEFRANVGIGEFKTGSHIDILGFVAFLLAIFVIAIMISRRSYHERRQVAVAILMLTILLSVLTILVSNSLLVLR